MCKKTSNLSGGTFECSPYEISYQRTCTVRNFVPLVRNFVPRRVKFRTTKFRTVRNFVRYEISYGSILNFSKGIFKGKFARGGSGWTLLPRCRVRILSSTRGNLAVFLVFPGFLGFSLFFVGFRGFSWFFADFHGFSGFSWLPVRNFVRTRSKNRAVRNFVRPVRNFVPMRPYRLLLFAVLRCAAASVGLLGLLGFAGRSVSLL